MKDNEGRKALDKIKDQVEVIKKLQNEVQMKIGEMNRNLAREKGKLRQLVNKFPKKDWELYRERVVQVTTKHL